MENKKELMYEIDEIMYKHLRDIHKDGYTKIHSELELPTYLKTLEDLGLVKINSLDEKYRKLLTVKIIVRIYLTEKGLESIKNYEKQQNENRESYLKQQIENVTNMDISSSEKAQIVLLLNLLSQAKTYEEVETIQKSVLKSIKRDKSNNFLYSLLSSIVANVLTSFIK